MSPGDCGEVLRSWLWYLFLVFFDDLCQDAVAFDGGYERIKNDRYNPYFDADVRVMGAAMDALFIRI